MDISVKHQGLLAAASNFYWEQAEPVSLGGSVRRWETIDRYYEARIDVDLFGHIVLTTINGGIGNRLGQVRVVAIDTEVSSAMQKIAKRRLARGYIEVAQKPARVHDRHAICI